MHLLLKQIELSPGCLGQHLIGKSSRLPFLHVDSSTGFGALLVLTVVSPSTGSYRAGPVSICGVSSLDVSESKTSLSS